MSYNLVGWENKPSTKTPIGEKNLNHMDKGIKEAHDILDTKANAITNTAQGESILLTDSANVPLESMSVFGKSWQNTVGGNQLLKYPFVETTKTTNGITYTDLGDGRLRINGTATSGSTYFNLYSNNEGKRLLLKAGEYTVSVDDKAEYVVTISSPESTISTLTLTRKSHTFTLSEDTEVYMYIYVSNGATINNVEAKIMLNKGTTALPWEPYVGGTPSPNQNYPQEIHSNGESKNLFNYLDIDYMVVNANGDKRKGASFKEPNTYTISQNGALGGTLYAKVLSADGTFGSTLYANTKVTATIGYGQTLLVYTEDVSLSLLENAEVQVERGSVQTEYKPYGGSIEYGVYGGNLFDANIITRKNVTVENGVMTFNIDTTDDYLAGSYGGTTPLINIQSGNYCVSCSDTNVRVTMYCVINGAYVNIDSTLSPITVSADTFIQGIRVRSINGTSLKGKPFTIMFNKGTLALPYEPYTKQPFTLQTPNGLRGLKVTLESEANYKDAEGNLWACDYVDFKRGKYVQRILKKTFTDFKSSGVYSSKGGFTEGYINIGKVCVGANGLSDKFRYIAGGNTNRFAIYEDTIYFTIEGEYTKEEWIAKMNEIQPTVYLVLKEPIETDLTEEEIAQYKALMMNYPNTTIINDANAYTEVGYVADTKCYIDNKFKELEIALANTNAQLL